MRPAADRMRGIGCAALVLLLACGGGADGAAAGGALAPPIDAGSAPGIADAGTTTPMTDAGPPTADAGPPTADAGTDAGTAGPDAGAPTTDAGPPTPDAGTPGPDAGLPGQDAGTDAGTPPVPAADAGSPQDPPPDPCGGVTAAGACSSPATLTYCSTPVDAGAPSLRTITCAAGESCVAQDGRAACVLQPGACRDGMSRCQASLLQTCAGAAWTTASTCPGGCAETALGASCLPVTGGTELYSGRLLVEALLPQPDRRDWSAVPVQVPGRGFHVASGYPDPKATDGSYVLMDATSTAVTPADAGKFTVKVRSASERTAEDRIFFSAVQDDGAGGMLSALLDPQLIGTAPFDPNQAKSARLWSWSARVNDVPLGQLLVRQANGSGAAYIWDALAAGRRRAESLSGRPGLRLAAWWASGTAWTCGACMFAEPVVALGARFDTQIALPGNPGDGGEWAISVVDHELGHWVMQSFGTSPREGGTHYAGTPTFPGQAWSEGWATFFSSDVRADPVYVDKQSGTMFWIDLGIRRYAYGPWSRPTPTGGLLQNMDENEVAATLWSLSQAGAQPVPLYRALASPHMNTPPYGRGYTRHTWTVTGPGQFTNVQDTQQPAPMLADELDALVCGGMSPAAVDATVQPATFYPYPSAAPLCP